MHSAWVVRRLTGSMRVRVTMLATAVFAVAAFAASTVLLHSVRASLEDQVRTDNDVAVAELADQVRAGTLIPDDSVPGVFVPAPGTIGFQVLSADGDVVAGSPDYVATAGQLLVGTEVVATPSGTFTVAVASPLDGVRRTVDTVEGYLTAGIVVMVALVGVAVWLVVRRALRPVERMRAEVEEITHGTLHRRVPVPATHDEIARLAGTMNAMLDRLEHSATRQRDFVSDASHELRSPLASMRTTLEVVPAEARAEEWAALRRELLDENQRMEALVDGLLELARADDRSGSGPVVTDYVDVAEVVADEAIRHRRVPVRVGRVDDLTVLGRADQLRRVLRNLLDNAERYAQSRIAVTVEGNDGVAVLIVDDDGPGVPESERVRVFDRFTRAGTDRSRDDGGAGLGLAIVKAIVERYDGYATIADSPLGGARATVCLRRAEARTPAGR